MSVLRHALSFATVSLTASFFGCGGVGGPSLTFAPTNYTLTVSPQPASVPAGGTVTFTATTNDPHPFFSWGMVGTAGTSTIPPTDAGSPNTQAGGNTFVYTAPATPPIYFYPDPLIPAGTVKLRTLDGLAMVETSFTITATSVTTGFYTPVSTSIALGGTLVINAYAVGSTNNAITLQVNGVSGGSTSAGTIAPIGGFYGQYQYTAPAAMPMTGSTITLTVISQADPTKSSNLTLTLH